MWSRNSKIYMHKTFHAITSSKERGIRDSTEIQNWYGEIKKEKKVKVRQELIKQSQKKKKSFKTQDLLFDPINLLETLDSD